MSTRIAQRINIVRCTCGKPATYRVLSESSSAKFYCQACYAKLEDVVLEKTSKQKWDKDLKYFKRYKIEDINSDNEFHYEEYLSRQYEAKLNDKLVKQENELEKLSYSLAGRALLLETGNPKVLVVRISKFSSKRQLRRDRKVTLKTILVREPSIWRIENLVVFHTTMNGLEPVVRDHYNNIKLLNSNTKAIKVKYGHIWCVYATNRNYSESAPEQFDKPIYLMTSLGRIIKYF